MKPVEIDLLKELHDIAAAAPQYARIVDEAIEEIRYLRYVIKSEGVHIGDDSA